MIIGIDGNEANTLQRVGVHQYSVELLNAFYRIRPEWKKDVQFIIYLREPPLPFLPQEVDGWNYKIVPGRGLWLVRHLMPQLFHVNRPDVFFAPSHYLPPLSPIPMVCTIHDLGYLIFTGQFKKYDFWQLKYWSAISIIISKYIIAVSKSTKDEIVRHYPFATNKISVIHHGYDHNRFNTKIYANVVRRVKAKYKIEKNYILFLGMLKPSKNIEGIIDAFSLIRSKTDDYLLVIAGKKGWNFQSIFLKVKEKCLENSVIFTDFIPEEDKPALLRGAKVFVSPSFWEGFGMHVLEAMACGTPVVVSKVASLPEVAGEAGIYVETDSNSIASGIMSVLEMPKESYNKLVKTTLSEAVKFNWDKTARETLEVLRKAGKK